MHRIKNDNNIKKDLRGKHVEIVKDDATSVQIRLLEDAGADKKGSIVSVFRSQVEEYRDESDDVRTYDPNFAEILDAQLNQPYETHGVPCANDACPNENGFDYELTGFIVSDKEGMYVEKQCTKCGTTTVDGDSDFHAYYRMDDGHIESIDDAELVAPNKNQNTKLLIVSADADTIRAYAVPVNDYDGHNLSAFNGFALEDYPDFIQDQIENDAYESVDFTHAIDI